MNTTYRSIAQAVVEAKDAYDTAIDPKSSAGHFERGTAWGELRMATRLARTLGGFSRNDSDTLIINWARKVTQ